MIIEFSSEKIFATKGIKNKFIEGESLAGQIDIAGPRNIDGVDLGELTFNIIGNFQEYEEYAEDSVVKTISGDRITLSWTPSNLFTAHAGKIDLWLEGKAGDGDTILKICADQPVTIKTAHRKYSVVIVSTIERLIQSISGSVTEAKQAAKDAVDTVAQVTGQLAAILADIAGLKTSVETAQSTAEAAQDSAEGKVSKTGDTMSGNLDVPTVNGTSIPSSSTLLTKAGGTLINGTFRWKSTTIDRTEKPNVWTPVYNINIVDKNDVSLGGTRLTKNANSNHTMFQSFVNKPNAPEGNRIEFTYGYDDDLQTFASIGPTIIPTTGGTLDVCTSGTFTTYVIYQANSSVNIASLVNQITGKQTQKGGVLVFSVANSRPADFPSAITGLYGSGYVIFGSYYQHIQYRDDNGVMFTARKVYSEDTWSKWVRYAGTLM